jgi:nondiscriminating aspartyl-tRNA synthetase
MKRILIGDLRNFIGQEVMIQGWIQTTRDQKRMQFIVMRDHTGLAQVIVEKSENPEIAATISSLSSESCLTITGKVVDNPSVKLGGFEVLATDVRVENAVSSLLPFDIFAAERPSQDKRLDWRFLDLRRPENLLIFKVQTSAEMAMREFWTREGFIEIHSPKFMGSPSESGAELFAVEYFGRTAYLAQSPQFYKQMAMASGFDKVFEIGPVFRANPSFTSRHDTEFTSVDVEFSWIRSHAEVMAFEERWLQHVLNAVKEKHGQEIADTFGTEIKVPTLPFPRITMKEAIALLSEQGYAPPPDKKGDLDPQGERLLAQHVAEKFGHEFVFLTDYPISVRPFYHMRYEDDPMTTKSFDLIWKGIEITTGAQREHRYETLARQALEKGLGLEPIQFYLDFFKYGCPPHGGFGFGLTRMLMIMLGVSNVREVTYIYRGPNRLHP